MCAICQQLKSPLPRCTGIPDPTSTGEIPWENCPTSLGFNFLMGDSKTKMFYHSECARYKAEGLTCTNLPTPCNCLMRIADLLPPPPPFRDEEVEAQGGQRLGQAPTARRQRSGMDTQTDPSVRGKKAHFEPLPGSEKATATNPIAGTH